MRLFLFLFLFGNNHHLFRFFFSRSELPFDATAPLLAAHSIVDERLGDAQMDAALAASEDLVPHWKVSCFCLYYFFFFDFISDNNIDIFCCSFFFLDSECWLVLLSIFWLCCSLSWFLASRISFRLARLPSCATCASCSCRQSTFRLLFVVNRRQQHEPS